MHFALTQRQHAAVLASIKYFALKLVNPKERENAMSAWQAMSSITHFSLPSETTVQEAAPVAVAARETIPIAADAPKVSTKETVKKAFNGRKGLAALQGKK